VAIRCPGCERSYDVALFPFGRTLHCACGRRVGLRLPAPAEGDAGEPRFAVDAMLGRLARWLRTIGCDTCWEADVDDAALVERAVAEGRWLLTRDRRLPEEWWVEQVVLIEAEEVGAQLRQVVRRFEVDWRRRLFTRCAECNALVEPASRLQVEGAVPPRILREQERFTRCPECGRVYWAGSHVARMRAWLEECLGTS
jgi:uncharacterized protein with PIN domain